AARGGLERAAARLPVAVGAQRPADRREAGRQRDGRTRAYLQRRPRVDDLEGLAPSPPPRDGDREDAGIDLCLGARGPVRKRVAAAGNHGQVDRRRERRGNHRRPRRINVTPNVTSTCPSSSFDLYLGLTVLWLDLVLGHRF